jgi:hypothetical protein
MAASRRFRPDRPRAAAEVKDDYGRDASYYEGLLRQSRKDAITLLRTAQELRAQPPDGERNGLNRKTMTTGWGDGAFFSA